MSDERIVDGFYRAIDKYVSIDRHEADLMLAALRADGFDVYRPDECEGIHWCSAHQSNYGTFKCDYALWKGYEGPPNECDPFFGYVVSVGEGTEEANRG